jgi:RHH-type proline utilization regulon transcriptional repressor/proline dehydrogenase/delta 1-pyrroline-5-carboxylate dehydrogenase
MRDQDVAIRRRPPVGTGPEAGGPNYLRLFASEQTITVNTAAAGGNASLLAQGE